MLMRKSPCFFPNKGMQTFAASSIKITAVLGQCAMSLSPGFTVAQKSLVQTRKDKQTTKPDLLMWQHEGAGGPDYI